MFRRTFGKNLHPDANWAHSGYRVYLNVHSRFPGKLRSKVPSPALTESTSGRANMLKGSQLGVAFRRQVLIGNRYIAEFLAPSIKLVVEVDGAYHTRRAVADARRVRFLRNLGYNIVRLDAELVATHLPQAIEQVRRAMVP